MAGRVESWCISMRHNAKGQQIIMQTYLDILYIFKRQMNERAHEVAMTMAHVLHVHRMHSLILNTFFLYSF